ncbi:hypothetical protein BAUCODRAFT_126109 [Baudoinia panamericana UAMH 10762]|uniref:Uncharacterized protein n=1 Tax=Baudoinia panamericana (strain UAMH 10762) TaxID=717646 RepID=M2ML55_BAUPA|nr:uncharacterized protein BAUCODRAFT_126109 [Baudoinia panamericana UAMH 10762]EMC92093.1 hypothetical protein BAUCODRAFT_126109 [Baudoinia panamericana UAMH 10762]
MTTNSSQTSADASPVSATLFGTSPKEEPCSCAAGGHEPMCANYRYGGPVAPKLVPAPLPATEPERESSNDCRWPPQANRHVAGDDGYSPAGEHPWMHCNSPQVPSVPHSIQAPAGSYATLNHARVPSANSLLHKQAASLNSFGRFVWRLPPGGSEPTVAYRSPQLFGEQAELPDTTTTERDEDFADPSLRSNPLLAKKRAQTGIAELDSTELAYWENGGLRKSSQQPDWL